MKKALLLALAAAAVPTAAALADRQAPPDTLRGLVVLGEDSVPVGGETVVLHRVTADTGMAVDSVVSDASGRFALPIDAGSEAVFLASVRHEGVLYFGPALHDLPQADGYRIAIFPSRPAGPDDGVTVVRRTIAAGRENGTLAFVDAIDVRGRDDATLVAPSHSAGGWWELSLPVGVGDVRAMPGGIGPEELEVGPGTLRLSAPIPASGQRVVVSYSASGAGPVTFTPDRPVGRFELVVRAPASRVRVEGLGEGRSIGSEGGEIRRWSARRIGPGDTVRVVAAEPAGGARPGAWIAAAIGVVLAAGAVVAWRAWA